MPPPNGFDYRRQGDRTVVITHHGKAATTLRGARAIEFLEEVDDDPQEVMARWTGNYRHGNERMSRDHPRNRERRH